MTIVGAKCDVFTVHHSLPHRSRMLEALSLLDTHKKSSSSAILPAEPNVIIRTTGSDTWNMGSSVRPILSTVDMAQYVLEAEGGSSTLLNQHGSNTQKDPSRQMRTSEHVTPIGMS